MVTPLVWDWQQKINLSFHDPTKAKGRLEKRNVENYILLSLLGHNCKPQHVLYACPSYCVLALLIKCMLPVKHILFIKRIFSCYRVISACALQPVSTVFHFSWLLTFCRSNVISSTVRRRMSEYGIIEISTVLKNWMTSIQHNNPNCGYRLIQGYLARLGYRIQQCCICESMARTEDV